MEPAEIIAAITIAMKAIEVGSRVLARMSEGGAPASAEETAQIRAEYADALARLRELEKPQDV